jgi:hypothetical protein
LGLRDEITASLPSSGSSISPITRTNNLKDIYVWTRLPKSSNSFSLETDTFLHEQINILNISNIGYASGSQQNAVDALSSIFDGSTSTSQQGLYAYDVINSTDSTGHIRFDYEFYNPTYALEIVFTDGNDTNPMGSISNMAIYSSQTGSKNDSEWDLHSTFTNVALDTNATKQLKVIQYNQDTEQWEYKGLFQVA